MHILVAVDGSSYTKQALAYLTTHDDWSAAHHQFTVVTVVPEVTPRAASVIAPADLKDYYDEEAQKVLGPVQSFLGPRLKAPVQYVTRIGHAAQEIIACVQETAPDLLVMGSHGHGNLGNLVMGSVATRVLAHSKVPVLLLR